MNIVGWIILVIISSLFSVFFYRRNCPVRGVPSREVKNNKDVVVLDTRDYNEMTDDGLGDLHIPYAYMKRSINYIPDQKLHLIAGNRLDLHLGLRYLMRKGYEVVSYEIKDCPCREENVV